MFRMAPHDTPARVENPPHQHAFTLVGEETIFGVHMTQYHCEVHKYQIILELEFPEEVKRALVRLRREYPEDFFVLCNQLDPHDPADRPNPRKEFSIPELAARRRHFTADIFQGIRPFEGEPGEHFFPWSADRCRPAIGDFEVTVKRIVTYRPFAHHYEVPDYATYLLWGKGDEAHMTNLQTAHRPGGPFDRDLFGADYDHVMSLKGPTSGWLEDVLLEAGIVVTLPDVRLWDEETGEQTIPCRPPYRAGETMPLYYRGMGPAHEVTAGPSFLFCTAVCNSPEMVPCEGAEACQISLMPEKYWT